MNCKCGDKVMVDGLCRECWWIKELWRIETRMKKAVENISVDRKQ